MINNFELIEPFLEFPNDDIYYHLQILRRGKDNPEMTGANRVIKSYFICNIESLKKNQQEIIDLCHYFNARAYINLAPKSLKKTTLLQMNYLSGRLYMNDIKKIWKSWNTCAGEIKGEKPRWVVDVDSDKWNYIMDYIDTLEPFTHRTKYITNIPTKSGWHIITTPFNLQQFKEKYPDIDVHRNNPTLLYCV